MSKEVKRYRLRGSFVTKDGTQLNGVAFVSEDDYEALLAERDAAQKDSDRLAWLIDNGVQVISVGGDPIRLTREAIDAALQGEQ